MFSCLDSPLNDYKPNPQVIEITHSDLDSGIELALDTYDTDVEADAMLIYTSGTTGQPKGAIHS